MILGFLPAPYVYGLLVDELPKLDDEGYNVSPWGMRGVTWYSLVGVISLALSIAFRKSLTEEESQEQGGDILHVPTQESIVAVMQESGNKKADGQNERLLIAYDSEKSPTNNISGEIKGKESAPTNDEE
jgi:hypothetical protein